MNAIGRSVSCIVALALLLPRPASAQNEIDVAMKFFSQGGAYCFRAAPAGVTMSDETEWTVMVLTGGSHTRNTFRIRTMDGGSTGLDDRALTDVGLAITGVWTRDRTREEFFARFAKGIAEKALRARIVRIAPAGIARMKPRDRAEVYLKFADRGTRVSFEKVPDVTAEELMTYAAYSPD
jgi:hypothetical protein